MPSRAFLYDLARDYGETQDSQPQNLNKLGSNPGWLIAVIRLNRPVTYSRRTNKSIGTIVEGAFTRNEKPFLIIDDCVNLTISSNKNNHTQTLQATLRSGSGGNNYLNHDILLPGDWLAAWCFNNVEDLDRIKKQIENFEPCNKFNDGLKFLGRAHSIHASLSRDPEQGHLDPNYQLTGIGFSELDTQFFYDTALATSANVSSDIRTFMAQLGLDFTDLINQEQVNSGRIVDNIDKLLVSLIDIILGRGIDERVNQPLTRADPDSSLKIAPQANKEAPFAYLVPRAIGKLLGRESIEGSKSHGLFGYADILETVIGTQSFVPDEAPDHHPMSPIIDPNKSRGSRKFTIYPLKGTFLPITPSFVNVPLWQLLQSFNNSAINEMYTAIKVNDFGEITPTLTVRQIPFSTESIEEPKTEEGVFKLTKFMSLPRWHLPETMVSQISVGRSDATRINMLHIYGYAQASAVNRSVTNQLVRNPPIFDVSDIQRSGIRAIMKSVNCALNDQVREGGARIWMEIIGDWTFGSHLTLNGTINSWGIQAPIAIGDNLQFNDMVYHIEGVSHNCQIDTEGNKTFNTQLSLSNGMPVDQTEATPDFPRYAGISNIQTDNPSNNDENPSSGDTLTNNENSKRTDTAGDDFQPSSAEYNISNK